MLNIVIPMAGRGSRFIAAGFDQPKPLIPVHGRPMIEVVVHNIRPRQPHRMIFLALGEHVKHYHLETMLHADALHRHVIPVDHVTEGAACTVLLARQVIDNDSPLMIANSDQWIDMDINEYLSATNQRSADGCIMTMQAADPKWSYVERNAEGWVTRVVEKEVVSEHATVGIYNFKAGRDFVLAADAMIHHNTRVNGEFYVAPVYNELIRDGAKIATFDIGPAGQHMHGLGTPADLETFLQTPASRRAVSF